MKSLSGILKDKHVVFKYSEKVRNSKTFIAIADEKIYIEGRTRATGGYSTGIKSVPLHNIITVFKGTTSQFSYLLGAMIMLFGFFTFFMIGTNTNDEFSMFMAMLFFIGAVAFMLLYMLKKLRTISFVTNNETIILPCMKLNDVQLDRLFDIIDDSFNRHLDK